MLLKRMKLTNFRQFIGEQEIFFSTDAERNVTVIMGENGTGKTTLAQAFTWCLYGKTDFDDTMLINKRVARNIGANGEGEVRVEICLSHTRFEYIIFREQKYTSDSKGNLKRPNNTVLKIWCKGVDGQQEFVKESEVDYCIKEILPQELAKYFFFDGERIGNMSKEIKSGKSQEFALAVKSLLGLSAFTAALEHLNGRSQNTVIKSYNKAYDSKSDSKISEYRSEIEKYDAKLEKIKERLDEIEKDENLAAEKIKEYERKIEDNKDSEFYAKKRKETEDRMKSLERSRLGNTLGMVETFNKKATMWMSTKLIKDVLQELADEDKIDTGIPNIHKKTIDYLVKRKRCICGEPIEKDNSAYMHLMELLEYIPPHSIGTSIGNFVKTCECKSKIGEGGFEELKEKYSAIHELEEDYSKLAEELDRINKKLELMQNVSGLQQKYMYYTSELIKLKREHDSLLVEKGKLETKRERIKTEWNELVLKDSNNKKIARFNAYATYMYNYLLDVYNEKERETREKLKDTVNQIFKEIYNGGFSIDIDEKYNIDVIVDEFDDNSVETSTAQSISVIFAFIAGVIKLAKEGNDDSKMLVSEVYPLVMDAPLSAFDKKRIKSVCEALPKVAEQVIIFIKDTDGEIAEENMSQKIGLRYIFDKKNELETVLVRR